MGRNDLCFCGSGLKQKKCHRGINEDSKWSNIYKANKDYESFVKSNNLLSQCPADCSVCCDALFPVSAEDFYIILDHLCGGNIQLIEEKIELANAISQKFQSDYPEAWKTLCEEMPTTDLSHLDLKYWGKTFSLDSSLPRCMFLSTEGKCEIYECRPMICRTFGTSSHCSIINNSNINNEESQRLYDSHNKITSNIGKAMVKRPYPLFYWFSHFLDDEFKRKICVQKISTLKSVSEDAYFRSHRM